MKKLVILLIKINVSYSIMNLQNLEINVKIHEYFVTYKPFYASITFFISIFNAQLNTNPINRY